MAKPVSSASHVGSYSINQGTLSPGSNYSIPYASATLGVATATLTASSPFGPDNHFPFRLKHPNKIGSQS
ncbi:MBG domain-containing protein [Zavarzinella formosa]|uniref:MBG domain-containing protein n=1 Tax=Zavarzinella formosa TaxID=360055 RepID=UPI0036F31671